METLESQVISEEPFATLSEVKIFTSNKYDEFKLSEFNRDPLHFKKVMESIRENDYSMYQPILVNSSMEIVDGQNRFLACKELGKPIHFIVSNDITIFAAADINQAAKNWSSQDYVLHYAKRGRAPYLKILDLCSRYGQQISMVSMFGKISGGARSITEVIKNGSFDFKEEIDVDDFFQHVKEFEEYYSYAKMEKFIKAVLRLYLSPNYSKELMINKLSQGSRIVKEQPRVDLMAEELLKLYNYNNRKPIDLHKYKNAKC